MMLNSLSSRTSSSHFLSCIILGWTRVMWGTSSLIHFSSVGSNWSSLLMMSDLNNIRWSFPGMPFSVFRLFLIHELLSAYVKCLLSLIFSLLKLHPGLDINGFHLLLIGCVQIVVNAINLLVVNSLFRRGLHLSSRIASWVGSWSWRFSVVSSFFGSHVVCLTRIKVNILIIIHFLVLLVKPSCFVCHNMLLFQMIDFTVDCLLLMSDYSLSISLHVLLSVHNLILFVHVESFNLFLVFSLLSLKLNSVNTLFLILVMMIINFVLILRRFVIKLVLVQLLRDIVALGILLHGSLSLWLSSSSWSSLMTGHILGRSINYF